MQFPTTKIEILIAYFYQKILVYRFMFFKPPLFQAAKIVFHFKLGLGSCTGLMVLFSDFQSLCGLINLKIPHICKSKAKPR